MTFFFNYNCPLCSTIHWHTVKAKYSHFNCMLEETIYTLARREEKQRHKGGYYYLSSVHNSSLNWGKTTSCSNHFTRNWMHPKRQIRGQHNSYSIYLTYENDCSLNKSGLHLPNTMAAANGKFFFQAGFTLSCLKWCIQVLLSSIFDYTANVNLY